MEAHRSPKPSYWTIVHTFGFSKALEGIFRGAGWNVIKVIWGSYWDQLLNKDKTGLLIKRMNECVDGEYQAFKAKGGEYVRNKFFGKWILFLLFVFILTIDI